MLRLAIFVELILERKRVRFYIAIVGNGSNLQVKIAETITFKDCFSIMFINIAHTYAYILF